MVRRRECGCCSGRASGFALRAMPDKRGSLGNSRGNVTHGAGSALCEAGTCPTQGADLRGCKVVLLGDRTLGVPGARGFFRPGFSLLELIIVICIIAVLVALMQGGLHQAWESSCDVECKANLYRLYQALRMGRDAVLPNPKYWVGFVENFGGEYSLLCPRGDAHMMDLDDAPVPGDSIPEDEGGGQIFRPPDPDDQKQNVQFMQPPPSVHFRGKGGNGDLESDTRIRTFLEKEEFRLPVSVQVNITGPGRYDSKGQMTSGTVDAGTVVNCIFVHFDPVGSGPAETSGSLSLTQEIIGIICLDSQLNRTDNVLGHEGTVYPNGKGSRGFENNAEVVSLSADKRTLIIHRFHSTHPGEQARILVECPEEKEDEGQLPDGGWGSDGGYGLKHGYSVGGPTSYGMNSQAAAPGALPGQVLLVEYRRALVDVDAQGLDDDLEEMLAPRHQGMLNVLFMEGAVRSMAPEELLRNPSIWQPKFRIDLDREP